MKTVKNIWVNVQKSDLITINGKDFVVVCADAKKNRSGSHLVIKAI